MATVTAILVDFSGSMAPKVDTVKKVLLEEVVPVMNYSERIGLSKFNTLQGKTLNVDEVLPLNKVSEATLREKITDLGKPDGGTPIAAAIKAAVEQLAEYKGLEKKIILLTDGEETAGGDYLEEARRAQNDGIGCEIHIIGFELNNAASEKAEAIAEVSGGSFLNINSLSDDSLSAKFSPFRKAIEVSRNKVRVDVAQKEGDSKATLEALFRRDTPTETNNGEGKVPDDGGAKTHRSVNTGNGLDLSDLDFGGVPNKPGLVEVETIDDTTLDSKEAASSGFQAGIVENATSEEVELRLEIKKLEQKVNMLDETVKDINSTNAKLAAALEAFTNKLGEQRVIDENIQGDVFIHENTEYNLAVGRKAEEVVFEHLKEIYGDKVRWNNEKEESYQDHDFAVSLGNQNDTYIECKGTETDEGIFFLTRNEWEKFINNVYAYQIYFVRNVSSAPKVTIISNLMDWLTKGKVVPYANKNKKVKAERVMLMVLD